MRKGDIVMGYAVCDGTTERPLTENIPIAAELGFTKCYEFRKGNTDRALY